MKVAIVGSRGYRRLDLVVEYVQSLPEGSTVVSGGAKGVDTAAEVSALNRGLSVEIHRPEWSKLGRRAGFERNKKIVAAADLVVAFWDGGSSGTAHSIQIARMTGKPLVVRGWNGEEMAI